MAVAATSDDHVASGPVPMLYPVLIGLCLLGFASSLITPPASGFSLDVAVTGADGQYLCPTLISGGSYEVVPTKNINHSEFISIADLIRLSRHLLGLEEFTSPFEYIAADCDNDAEITFASSHPFSLTRWCTQLNFVHIFLCSTQQLRSPYVCQPVC